MCVVYVHVCCVCVCVLCMCMCMCVCVCGGGGECVCMCEIFHNPNHSKYYSFQSKEPIISAASIEDLLQVSLF